MIGSLLNALIDTILKHVVGKLCAALFQQHAPAVSRWLVLATARLLPEDDRDMHSSEWLWDIDNIKDPYLQIASAISVFAKTGLPNLVRLASSKVAKSAAQAINPRKWFADPPYLQITDYTVEGEYGEFIAIHMNGEKHLVGRGIWREDNNSILRIIRRDVRKEHRRKKALERKQARK